MGDGGIGAPTRAFGNVGTWHRGNDWMLASNTDESVIRDRGTNGDALTPLATLGYLSDNLQVRATWIGLYEGVFRANLVIQGTQDIPVTGSEDLMIKNTIIGEARFMRGMYHFYLMTLFGGVPIVEAPTQDNTLTRNSVEEMAAFIEQDFLFSIENIRTDRMDNGRAGKFSAAAYLAKMHLFLASCKEYDVNNGPDFDDLDVNSFDWVNVTEHYQAAANYTDMIYGNYSLVPDYRYLFMIVGDAVQRDEFIFNIEFSAAFFHRDDRLFTTSGNSRRFGGSAGHLHPTPQMLTMHNSGDDRIKNLQGSVLNANRDVTEYIDDVPFLIPQQARFTNRNNQYNIAKWRRPYWDLYPSIVFNGTTDVNYPLIRYADILLMRAEAHFKLTNSRTGIPDAMLTEVRQRSAGGTDVATLNADYLRADFMVEMMEERSRELCYEGWRRIDLIRTNTYASAIGGLDETQAAPNLRGRIGEMKENFELFKMWYPIPQVELLLSPNLDQNPGYLEAN